MSLYKKIVFIFQKVFLEQEVERNTHCIHCGKTLSGSQRRFCSDVCNNSYWRKKYTGKVETKNTPIGKLEIKRLKAQEKAIKKYPRLKECEICGEKSNYRYHQNLNKPLDINFLCWSCLGKVYAKIISVKREEK